MADPVRNFAKVTVSTGYDELAVTIVLSAGQGAKLPDPATNGPFNLIWYNATDYPDPSDDPNVEIVRCTARSVDTLTVTRGQEGIAAQTHNMGGKSYKMILAFTQKTYDDLASGGIHHLAHENGVLDEIDVTGLSGELADPQPVKTHGTSHQNGQADEFSVAGLSGELADPQPVKTHKTSHENGGGDEISIAGLSGEAADAQKITVRKNSGADIGTRKRINLIEGANITLTIADDAVDNEIDVTVIGAAGGGGGSGGINLAPNSSFEMWHGGIASAPSRWEKIGAASIARDAGEKDGFGGEYALKVISGGSGNEGIQFTFKKLKPSTQYAVSVRAKATSGDTAKIWTTGGSVNVSQTTTETGFTLISGTFTTDATPSDIILCLGSDNNGDIVWFDQLQINEGATAFTYCPNPKDRPRIIHLPASTFESRAATAWANFVQTQGTNFDYGEFDFDPDTDEKIISPPLRLSNWNGGNIFAKIGWKANATTGNVMWILSFLGRDTMSPEAWDAAFSDHSLPAEGTPGTAEYLKETLWEDLVGELAKDDAVLMKITRDADSGSDSLAVDAKFLYAELGYWEA